MLKNFHFEKFDGVDSKYDHRSSLQLGGIETFWSISTFWFNPKTARGVRLTPRVVFRKMYLLKRVRNPGFL